MSELLSLIDADSNELEVTATNNLRWIYPIDGETARKEEYLTEPLPRKYPRRAIGSTAEDHPLTIMLYIMGNTRAELEARLQDLIWRTDPDRGAFIIKRTTSAGNVRQMRVYRHSYSADSMALALRSQRMKLDIECLAPNPLWYDPTPVTVLDVLDGVTPVTLTMDNAYVETPLYIALSGDADTPRFVLANGGYYEWEYAMSGERCAVFQFDSELSTFGVRFSGEGDEDFSGYAADGSRALWAPPGSSNLTATAEAGSTAGITVTFTKFYKVLA